MPLSSKLNFKELLSAESRKLFTAQLKKSQHKKGEVIIEKGQALNGVYLVESGRLRVYSLDLQGNEKPIYFLDAGEMCFFSIHAVMKNILYPAWVTVDSPKAKVISIPGNTFRILYEQEAAVREFVLDAMSSRVLDLMTMIEELSIQELGPRINSYLVRHCDADGLVRLSHQDIATALGTAREVVSRHLKMMERDGFITLARMKIQVLNPQQLARLSVT